MDVRRRGRFVLAAVSLCLLAAGCSEPLATAAFPEGRQIEAPGVAKNLVCDLPGACGESMVQRLTFDYQALISTWKQGPGPTALWVAAAGAGKFKRGTQFPKAFFLSCGEISANTCTDTHEEAHSCAQEHNSMAVYATHSAFTNGQIYHGDGSAEGECDDSGGSGGGGGGGLNCEAVRFTVEVWNGSSWEYHSTVTGWVCV